MGKTLTIIIGGSMKSDYDEIFSKKPLSSINQPRNALYLDSFEQLSKILSPKRADLLRYLMSSGFRKKPKPVSSVAKSLDRHQEAISRDLNQLKKLGIVTLKRVKQAVYAMPSCSSIAIKIC